MSAAAEQLASELRKSRVEKLANAFIFQWNALKGAKLMREYRFHDTRRWRFDFAHEASKVAIELEGGIWTGGAHTRGGHFISDCTKYNAATAAGWRVFRLTGDMINRQHLEPIIAAINQGAPQ